MTQSAVTFHPYPDPKCKTASAARAYRQGACYVLPEGLTWETVARYRADFGIALPKVPLGRAPGALAWGVVFECDLKIAG